MAFDRHAAAWRAATNAVRQAGANHITITVLALDLLLHGFDEYKGQRDAALALLETWERDGVVGRESGLAMRQALGAISSEQYDHDIAQIQHKACPGGEPTVNRSEGRIGEATVALLDALAALADGIAHGCWGYAADAGRNTRESLDSLILLMRTTAPVEASGEAVKNFVERDLVRRAVLGALLTLADESGEGR